MGLISIFLALDKIGLISYICFMTDEKKHIKDRIIDLRNELQASLLYDGDDEELAELLQAQAKVLDRAFRSLLGAAPGRYEEIAHYGTALKAQNQFRHTALAVNALKNKKSDEENSDAEKEKRVKRTIKET